MTLRVLERSEYNRRKIHRSLALPPMTRPTRLCGGSLQLNPKSLRRNGVPKRISLQNLRIHFYMLVLYCIVCMCTVCMRYPRAETYAVIYIHTCMHTVCLTCMHAVCLLACRTNVGMHTVHICHHMLHAIQKSGI